MNHQKITQANKGFTLVEMMVSISIFAIVLVVIMGSIITIIDVNRKAQSLTIVTNELSFAIESFTRSIKTGVLVDKNPGVYIAISVTDQDENVITYRLVPSSDTSVGRIERAINRAGHLTIETVSLTSDQIDIEEATFTVFYEPGNKQPRVLMQIDGIVKASPMISSEFKIQTSVSPRALDKDYVQQLQ